MVSNLKNISDDKKRLLSNFFSLSFLRGANYLLPLITLPYLVRVLGPQKFGLIAFAQAIIQYFVIFTDYGFNLSATREISIHRENKKKVSEIFCSVLLIKFALLVVSFIILSAVVFGFNKFKADWGIYYLAFGMVIGQVMFPVWFFQGMEKMKYIATLNILAKLFFTVSIFVIVRHEADYRYVPLLNSLGFIIAGFTGLWVVLRRFKIGFEVPAFAAIRREIENGWHIFISTLAISLYTTSNTVILGIFTNNTIVGYYAAGEKIIRAITGMITPLSQTIYPHICKVASESRERALSFVRKILMLIEVPLFLISIAVLLFARHISNLVLGEHFQESIPIIRILSFLPFIVAASIMLGSQTLLVFGIKRLFSMSIVFPALVHIVFLLFVTPFWGATGVAIVCVFTELLILFWRVIGIRIFHKELFTGIFCNETKN